LARFNKINGRLKYLERKDEDTYKGYIFCRTDIKVDLTDYLNAEWDVGKRYTLNETDNMDTNQHAPIGI
jgi:hypothetical protein